MNLFLHHLLYLYQFPQRRINLLFPGEGEQQISDTPHKTMTSLRNGHKVGGIIGSFIKLDISPQTHPVWHVSHQHQIRNLFRLRASSVTELLKCMIVMANSVATTETLFLNYT